MGLTNLFVLLLCVAAALSVELHPRLVYHRAGTIDTRDRTPQRKMRTQAVGEQGKDHFYIHMDPSLDLHPERLSANMEIFKFFGTDGEYIPSNTWKLYVDVHKVEEFQRVSKRVLWVDDVPDHHKYDSSLLTAHNKFATQAVGKQAEVVLIAWLAIKDQSQTETLAAQWQEEWQGSFHVKFLPSGSKIILRVSIQEDGPLAELLKFVSAKTEVMSVTKHIEPEIFTEGTNTYVLQGNEFNVRPVWDMGIKGEGQVISVPDTGVDIHNCHFIDTTQEVAYCVPNEVCITNANHRKILAYVKYDHNTMCGASEADDFWDQQDATDYSNGHGTFASNMAMGSAPDSLDHAGMAPAAKLVVVDIAFTAQDLDNNGIYETPTPMLPCLLSDLYSIPKAVGAKIHSSSWGAGCKSLGGVCVHGLQAPPYTEWGQAIDNYMFQYQDEIHLFAAGNFGDDGVETVVTPANCKNALAVGSSVYGNSEIAGSSSTGPTGDGRIKPDIVAPGQRLTSAAARFPVDEGHGECDRGVQSGTSYATPSAAGAMALIRQFLQEGWYGNGGTKGSAPGISSPRGDLMKNLVLQSADFLYSFAANQLKGPSPEQGWGRVNLKDIMVLEADEKMWFSTQWNNGAVTSFNPVNSGPYQSTYCFTLTKPGRLRVLLNWMEPASSTGIARGIPIVLNDFDLTVHNQDGTTWRGNDFKDSKDNSIADHVNLQEKIDIETAPAGSYSVSIYLKEIIGTSGAVQPFVVSVIGMLESTEPSLSVCPAKCPTFNGIECAGAGTCTAASIAPGSRKFCTCSANYDSASYDCSIFNQPVSDSCNNRGAGGPPCTMCYADAVNGYYDPATNCANCASGYALNTTTNLCTIDTSCSGNGDFVNQACSCNVYAAGSAKGSFKGESCAFCADGYEGETCICQTQFLTEGKATSCDATGLTCADSNEAGHWDHPMVGGEADKSSCSACKTGYFGPECKFSTGCSDQGTFNTATEKCDCLERFAGTECDICAAEWNHGPIGANCSCKSGCGGHGTCTDQGCQCDASYATGWWGGSDCKSCADGYITPGSCKCQTDCGGKGICGPSGCECYDSFNNGHFQLSVDQSTCDTCAEGWAGPTCKCSTEGGTLCQGHGTCTANGCECYDNITTGYWGNAGGQNCKFCKDGYVGLADSNTEGCRCPRVQVYDEKGDVTIQTCAGHGQCASDAGCICNTNPVNGGNWTRDPAQNNGESCDTCATGWRGVAYTFGSVTQILGCACKEPAAGEDECGVHGECKIAGCSCHESFATGYWNGDTDCTSCSDGWHGPTCKCYGNCGEGLRGTCSANGCSCFNNLKNGFFQGDPAYGIGSGGFSATCTWCAAGYVGNNTIAKCLCTEGQCNAVAVTPDSSADDSMLSFTDLEIKMTYAAGAAGTTSNASLQFQLFNSDQDTHPLKGVAVAPTPDTTYNYAGASFTLSYELPEVVISEGHKFTTQATDAFPGPLQLSISFKAESDLDLSVQENLKIDYDARPPALYFRNDSGWYPAREMCPIGERIVNEYDAQNMFITTNVCGISGQVQFALLVAQSNVYPIWVYATLGGICFALIIVIIVVVVIYRKKVKKERALREQKERVLALIMKSSLNKGKSLRQKIGLRMNEELTPEKAIERILKVSERTRAVVKHMQAKGYATTPTLTTLGNNPSPMDAAAAIGLVSRSRQTGQRIFEFKDHELELLDACVKIRNMFKEDPFSKEYVLKPNTLPEVQSTLIALQIENEKLRKLQGTTTSQVIHPR